MCSKPSIFIFLLCLFFATVNVSAQTIVSGNVSGIWNIGGNPYLLIDDCTVQTGTELTIEPGVEIVIGESMSLNVYGKISANGTSSQNIIFRAVNDSVKFNRVYVLNGSSAPPVSEFKYCEFSNAQTGLYLHAYGRIDNAYTTMQTNVSNCSFDSSVSTAIYVRAQAVDASQYMTPRRRHARVNPIITACTFNGNGVGIEMNIQGAGSAYFSNGDTEAIVQNNAFLNLQGAAISMLDRSLNSGIPSFVNNTIVNCNRGIWIQDPHFDATIINNIFYGTTATAIERTGSNSSIAFYNCFYGNTNDFVGYPATYGDIVMTNPNGDPCDLGFNIFQDPLFASLNDYIFSPDSPCIGAGIDTLNSNSTQHVCPPYDIEGNPRPNPPNTSPDIGAWESDYPTKVDERSTALIPDRFDLEQNYPNPFNPETEIRFQIPKQRKVVLVIYNTLGQKIKTLVNNV